MAGLQPAERGREGLCTSGDFMALLGYHWIAIAVRDGHTRSLNPEDIWVKSVCLHVDGVHESAIIP